MEAPKFPAWSPLQNYRKAASFDWWTLKRFLEGPYLEYKQKVYEILAKDPLFRPELELEPSSREKQREKAILEARRLIEYDFSGRLSGAVTKEEEYFWKDQLGFYCAQDMSMGGATMCFLHFLFCNTIERLGSERHRRFFLSSEEPRTLRIFGCFALTEFSHGTNTKEMRTTATYEHESQEFILNNPDEESAKWWVGNLGKHATHAIVAAQLIYKGKNLGLHWFVVQIRDMDTHLPLAGVTVGDIGLKGGWNFEDNGFVMFNNLRIPRENLLNRYQDITPDGRYILHVENEAKRFGLTLGNLSAGRVGIAVGAVQNGRRALVIAIRYSAVRAQFGPKDKPESPVIEYQLQQYRLLPFLAGILSTDFFSKWLMERFTEMTRRQRDGDTSKELAALSEEIHALSSGAKPVVTWFVRDVIQSCRECCGGHGYSAYSRIPRIREDHDPSMTYEGDNNVLIQQLIKYLLKALQMKQTGKNVSSPLGSLRFIENIESLLNEKCNFEDPKQFLSGGYLNALKWRVCYLLSEGGKKLMAQVAEKDPFTAFNDSQVFYLQAAAKAFMELIIIERNLATIATLPSEFKSVGAVLQQACDLFALWCMEKDLAVFLMGGHFNSAQGTIIRDLVLSVTKDFKNEAISIIDAVAPPDQVLWSPMGQSDGQVYKHLFNSVRTAPGVFERSSYWPMLRTPVKVGSLRPKL